MATPLPACFKAYDIRGRVPDELDERLAEGIGRALVDVLRRDRETGLGADERRTADRIVVAVGRDVRLSSPALVAALSHGITRAGGNVLDIGLCGTEMVYFSVFSRGLDGGVMVTASHNPMDYNGMKPIRVGARPISGDTGLHDLGRAAAAGGFADAPTPGTITQEDVLEDYVAHLLTYVDRTSLRPLRIVFDAGNGCAGLAISRLVRDLPFEAIEERFEPDGTFPGGVPNPLLPSNRAVAANAVMRHGADLGVAFDGDFDRCFFFDEQGRFIEGYYIVGLLARQALQMDPGARIVHDPRLVWNTADIVRAAGGTAVMSKTGHAFIKERMRLEDATYGGEMSAHHYFRRFGYCDSGMIPWLLVAQHLGQTGLPMSRVVGDRIAAFPCSGEINRTVDDIPGTLARIREHLLPLAVARDDTDGLSLDFGDWRMNLRGSNTEPLLRLNLESRGDPDLLAGKTREVLALIDAP
jgi:phosphomannomutase/phosphomannomutase/phosphoglucomutase